MKVDEILDLVGLGTWMELLVMEPQDIEAGIATYRSINHNKPPSQTFILSYIQHTSHENPSKPPKKWQRLPGIVVVRVSLRRFDGLPKERHDPKQFYEALGCWKRRCYGVPKDEHLFYVYLNKSCST